MQIFEFSLVGSGDWIDIESAKQFGYDPTQPDKKSRETPTSICHHKHKIDLSKPAGDASRIDQAIMFNYQILIENVIEGIINGFNQNIDKWRAEEDQEIPIVMAGGTASPNGFKEYFENILNNKEVPFKISGVKVMPKPLFAVSEGCLIAAEHHEDE